MSVSGATASLAVGVLVWLVVWLIRRRRPTIGAMLVRDVDTDPEVDGMVTTRAARMAAYRFKAEFGEMRYNKANRIIAGEWVRRHFKAMDMRDVDIVRHMDIAVELCLLPTSAAVMAAEFARTREVCERRSAVDPAK